MAHPPTVLCVTRAYPPVVGGMEKLSAEFTGALAQKTKVLLIANRHGKKALPLFLPWAAWRLKAWAPRVDVIHLGDPLLTVLLPVLPKPRQPVAVTVHGLDIRYPQPLYQAILRRFLPQAQLAVCISRFVEGEVRQRFPGLPTTIITPGIAASFAALGSTRADLEHSLGKPLGTGPLLLAVARLVPRKGLAWFVETVLPRVPAARLLIVGNGPEQARIAAAARARGISNRVTLAGALQGDTLSLAYRVADLLVMPNVPVPGDAEGFGLVALEAAAAGLPVVAADLEGIPDAVVPGETGVLAPPGDARSWVNAITELLNSPSRRQYLKTGAPKVVRERFAWNRRAEQALQAFAGLVSKNTDLHLPA